jgi:ABC-type transporter Mla maintaining outer membrane lipid asymmetry ATPase subunit MlaF
MVFFKEALYLTLLMTVAENVAFHYECLPKTAVPNKGTVDFGGQSCIDWLQQLPSEISGECKKSYHIARAVCNPKYLFL